MVHQTIGSTITKLKQTKKKKRLLLQCLEGMFPYRDIININKQYNLYLTDYETLMSPIEINVELGTLLTTCNDPNAAINNYIKDEKAVAICIYG